MEESKILRPILESLSDDERTLAWAVSLDESTGKETLERRLGWGSTKLNACLASLKRKNALSISTLPKDGTGRKPLSFSLAPEFGYFLGIHCDLTADYFVLLDASGRKVAERSFPVADWEDNAERAFIGNTETFLSAQGEYRNRTLAAGVSSAIRFNKKGSAGFRSPFFTNDAIIPLIGALGRHFGFPVSVGRPQVLLCYQGDLRSLVCGKESFINIIATDNLGIAIFINGESWLGQSGLSGDLGHLKVAGNDLPCYCGGNGCLRTKLSFMGICQETRRRLDGIATEGGSRRLDPADFDGPDYTSGVVRLIEAANAHDALATGIVYDAATALGSALATVVSLFNPARLIVNSVLSEVKGVFAEQVRAMVRKNCLELYSQDLTLEFKGYSPEDNAAGAAMFSRGSYLENVLDIR